MERQARAGGAQFAVREGWNIALAYTDPDQELELCRTTAGWSDVSHLGKLEVQAASEELAGILMAAGCGGEVSFAFAVRSQDAWWCRLTPVRALVVCDTAALARAAGAAARGRRGGDRSPPPCST